MYPRDHLAIGSLFSILFAYLFFWPSSYPLIISYTVLGVAASVLIDVDHVFVTRYMDGEWRTTMKGVSIPTSQKYPSHLSILATVSIVSVYFNSEFGYFITSLLVIHVLCDVYADSSNYWDWREGDL